MQFVNHPDIETPRGNTVIWRYMAIEKFLNLLVNKSLFFTNASKLTDEYEVLMPQDVVDRYRSNLIDSGVEGRDLVENVAMFEYNKDPKKWLTFVNCWSIGRHESFALWKIYLGGSGIGVAIRTNVSNVKQSIMDNGLDKIDKIYLAKVSYENYIKEFSPSRQRLVSTKREFYSYENEARFFILEDDDHDSFEPGKSIPVDLDVMIDKIYISPFMPEYLIDTMKKAIFMMAPKLAKRIIRSEIRDR